MCIRTTSLAVGVHGPTTPVTHAISRKDTFKDKKLIESCCVVFAGGEILASRVPFYGTKDAGARIVASIEEDVQTVQIFH